MVNAFSKGLVVLAIAMVSSCAQFSPQQISLSPAIEADNLIQGAGSLSLEVVDDRSDAVIGSRGGSYPETSIITAQPKVVDVVSSLASQVFERSGFEVTNTFPEQQVTLRVVELSYVTEPAKASIRKNTATAAIAVEVTNDNQVYRNNYRTTRFIETLGYPSEEENEELINSVLEAVLQRLFSDRELEAFLNR